MEKVEHSGDGKKALDSTFSEFISNSVSTKKSETDIAKDRWREVVAHLKDALGSDFKAAFLAGSYARKVQVRKLKDVDIVIEIDDPDDSWHSDAHAALLRFAEALSDFPGLLERPEIGVRAVTIRFTDVDFKIDVVPAIPVAGGHHLLAVNDRASGENAWTSASPKLQLTAASEKNALLDGKYTPATKLIKEWNQSFGEGELKPMPSYLAESILFHALAEWNGFENAIVQFFEFAERQLADARPTVTCPGDPDNFVDEKLEESRRERALNLVRRSLDDARAAKMKSNEEESLDMWAEVFVANDFPAPKNDRAKLVSALGGGGVIAHGNAVKSGGAGRKISSGRSWRRD